MRMVILHHPESAHYATPGHPEQPARVVESAAHLSRALNGAEWRQPAPAPDASLELAHTSRHLARLQEARSFDADTPYHENIGAIARLAAGAALQTMQLARRGHPAFSLMRPPGHHATAEQAMGFCYLNHVAIAALQARAQGVGRVAIWDFDAHHGNGTEAILRGREDVQFVSVHQHPGYPGTGAASDGNCLNFPVRPETPAAQHLDVLRQSWQAVLDFKPDLVLVSAGFDAYVHDPITSMCLQRDDFLTLGRWLHDARMPVGAVLEGGYSRDLPALIGAFLEGWMLG